MINKLEEANKKAAVYTAQQIQQQKQCYALETNTSLKMLRSIQKRSSIANVCEDNLSNFNKVIDRKQVDVYVTEKKTNQIQNNHLVYQLQYFYPDAMEEEENLSGSNGDWQPDEESEGDSVESE